MSLVSGIASARIGSTSVGHDFGEKPLGKFADLNLAIVEAGASRTKEKSFLSSVGDEISSLFGQLRSAVRSDASRVDLAHRDQLKRASGEVAELLGTICKRNGQAPNPYIVSNLLQALPVVTSALTDPVNGRMTFDVNGGDSNVQYEQGWRLHMLVKERTIVHVSNMTPQERESLREGLDALKATHVANDPIVKTIEGALREAAMRDLRQQVEPSLDLMLAQATQGALDGAMVTKSFQTMQSIAKSVLAQAGFGTLPNAEQNKLALVMVLDFVDARFEHETAIKENGAIVQQLGAIVEALPKEVAGQWLAVSDTQFVPSGHVNVHRALMGSVDSRVQEFAKGPLKAAVDRELGQPLSMDDSSVGAQMNALNSVVEEFDALERWAIGAAHYGSNEVALAQRNEIRDYLDHAAKSDESLIRGYSDATLQSMQSLAKAVGAAPALAVIHNELLYRRVDSAYEAGITAGAKAAASGDLSGLLQHLGAAAQSLPTGVMNKYFNAGGGDATAAERVFSAPLASLDDQTLAQLHAQLESPAMSALSDEMMQAGMSLMAGALEGSTGERILSRMNDLQILQKVVAFEMEARNVDPVKAAAVAAQASPAKIMEDVFAVIKPGAAAPYVIAAGIASAPSQKIWMDSLESLQLDIADETKQDYRPESQNKKSVSISGASAAAFCQIFVKDLKRGVPFGHLTITDANGVFQPLAPASGSLQDIADASYANLMQMTNNDHNLVMLVSQLANQAVMKGIWDVLVAKGGDNPLRGPDGTAWMPTPPPQRFHFSADGAGGVNIRVEFSDPHLPEAGPAGAIPTTVNAARSELYMSSMLNVAPNSQITVIEPLKIRGRLDFS